MSRYMGKEEGAEWKEQEDMKDVLGLPGWRRVKLVPRLLIGAQAMSAWYGLCS